MADPALDALAIHVETQGSVVFLRGRVPDEQSAERATRISRAVPGVKELHNELVIGKTPKH